MFLDIEQNTDEWLSARAGHLTGSAASKIMANYGKSFGEPAKKLAVNIAVEQITGVPISEGYSNSHMERGHEQEPIARMRYEEELFCDVKPGGFFDNGFTGCSPDGLVDSNGVVEIKSVIASQQYKRIKSGAYDSAYKWQLIFNLIETGREWIDYVSFCATFPAGKELFMQRIFAAELETEFEMVSVRTNEFKELVRGIKLDIEANA